MAAEKKSKDAPADEMANVDSAFAAMARGEVRVSKNGKFCSKELQMFGGLVLGCIKTKVCKKVCV